MPAFVKNKFLVLEYEPLQKELYHEGNVLEVLRSEDKLILR